MEVSSQPTHTWVDTSVVIGEKCELNAKDWLDIATRSNMNMLKYR